MVDLVSLPGIGRKTANVILGNAFGVPGITVDTHFARLVGRWQWTDEVDPVKIEHAVGKLIERREWTMLSHRVIFHGRRVCHARKPACGACTLAKDCPAYGTGPTDPDKAAAAGQGSAGGRARSRWPEASDAGTARIRAAVGAVSGCCGLHRRGTSRRRKSSPAVAVPGLPRSRSIRSAPRPRATHCRTLTLPCFTGGARCHCPDWASRR